MKKHLAARFLKVLPLAFVLWMIICIVCMQSHPDNLSQNDLAQYQLMAVEFYEKGYPVTYGNENLTITRLSSNCIKIEDISRPFSAGIIFNFAQNLSYQVDYNSGFVKVVLPILLAIIVITEVIAYFVEFLFKEGG